MDVNGLAAIVTGGASGLGRATAEALGLSYDQLRHAMKRLQLNAEAS